MIVGATAPTGETGCPGDVWDSRVSPRETARPDPFLTTHTRMNSEWIVDLNGSGAKLLHVIRRPFVTWVRQWFPRYDTKISIKREQKR